MNEKSKDGMDEFIRSKFKASDAANNHWNVPVDGAFQGAMTYIRSQQKKRRDKFIIILLFAIVISGLGSILLITYNHIQETNRKIKDVEVALSKLESGSEPGKSEAKSVQIVPLSPVGNENNSEIEKEKSSKNQIEVPLKSGLKKELTHRQSDFQKTVLKNNSEPLSKPGEAHKEDISNLRGLSNDNSNRYFGIDRIGLIRESIVPKDAEFLLQSYFSPIVDNQNQAFSKISFELLLVNNYSSLGMKNIPGQESASLENYNNNYPGYGISLGVQFGLNQHFSIIGKSAYQRYHNKSLLADHFLYDKSLEQSNPSGTGVYSSFINLETPLGNARTATSFEVETSMANNLDVVDHKSWISQKVDVISFGAGLRAYPLIHGKIRLFAGGGLNVNFILDANSEMDSELYMHGQMISKFDSKPELDQSLKSPYYSGYLESGIEFQVSNRFSLITAGQYQRSFTSLRNDPPNGPQTFLHNFNFGLGTKISF